ncbi:MAG: threonine aldolase family protein, partial [Rhodospirillaceae bacterium]
FGKEASAFLVMTGTAANILSIDAVTRPFEAVLISDCAHLHMDECGAPEFFSGGARLLLLPGEHDRIDRAAFAETLEHYPFGRVHAVQPSALSLTNVTESGTLYQIEEIAALADLAHGKGLGVHLDGARFGHALAALDCTPAELTWKAGVDALSLGATKSGALCAEAVVVFNPETALAGFSAMPYLRKRSGHLLSKMRFATAQMQAWLDGDAGRRAGGKANAMAALLARGVQARNHPAVEILHPVEANMVFLRLPEAVSASLSAAGHHFYPWEPDGPGAIRLVCSHSTTAEGIEAFLADLGAALTE